MSRWFKFEEDKSLIMSEELRNKILNFIYMNNFRFRSNLNSNNFFVLNSNNFIPFNSSNNNQLNINKDNTFIQDNKNIINNDFQNYKISNEKKINENNDDLKGFISNKYTSRFEIQIENDKDFQIVRRIIGSKVILL